MSTRDNEIDWHYSPEFVREMLLLWDKVEALREKGSYILDPIVVAVSGDQQDKADWAKEWGIRSWSRPTRKSNSVYRIDDVGAIICDIERALEKAISPLQKQRLMLHYLHGYEYAEIAKMEESNEEVVKVACWRAINKMVEFLEAPAEPKPDAFIQPPKDEGYKRKYTSIPTYA